MQKVKGRSKSSKSVVVVGDMHVGHEYALGSNVPKLAKVNAFWESAQDKLKQDRSNVLVINGEPIDGDNPRGLGGEQWTSDMGEQMQIANDYLECFKTDSIGLTRGSNYHVSRGNTGFESILTKYLTCAPILEYSPYGKQVKSKRATDKVYGERDPVSHRRQIRIEDILQIKVHDSIFNFLHHTGVSSSFTYAPTSIATQMLKNMIITGKLWSHNDAPQFTVRSHTHQFVLVEYGNTVGWVNPAWQVFSKYTLQKSMSAATIGLVEVIIEPNKEYIIHKLLLPDKDYPKIDILTI